MPDYSKKKNNKLKDSMDIFLNEIADINLQTGPTHEEVLRITEK
jgi:hypothetical protein